MKKTILSLLATAIALASPVGGSPVQTATEGRLSGFVASRQSPVSSARVYAYELADLTLREVATDSQGRFVFSSLPAGLYKLVTFKAGFMPAITMLSRAARSAEQFVEVQLAPEPAQRDVEEQGYWQVRSQIPSDVLHRIDIARTHAMQGLPGVETDLSHVQAKMKASTGVDEAAGSTTLARAEIDLEAKLGRTMVGVGGQIEQYTPSGDGLAGLDGQSTNLQLRMRRDDNAHLAFATTRNRLVNNEADNLRPVDLERYSISWSQAHGERSASQVQARYETQSNFYRTGWLDPYGVPLESQSWSLQGSYQNALTDRAGLETGLRYREREAIGATSENASLYRSLELFGEADHKIGRNVLVEYGLVTQMTDGSMALSPRGSVMVRFASDWTARATASGRFENGEVAFQPIFRTEAFRGSSDCSGLDEYCYRVLFNHEPSEKQSLEIGALDREIGETLQVYFNPDFVDRLESLFLVEGDRIPELQFAFSRQITPRILARLESNVAEGGGGILYATDDVPYENRVRYFVTSLDTRFQASSTGVFLAFHQLEQSLRHSSGEEAGEREMERLQLLLTQDLTVLANLASEWAVQLNMELSRGNLPLEPETGGDDDIRRRITGGVSVRF